MSAGARGAENTKAFFGQFTHGFEDLRQNINSYADGIVSGTHSNTADNSRDSRSSSRDYHNHAFSSTTRDEDDGASPNQSTGHTGPAHTAGFSKDSQRAGEKIKDGATSLERKFREKQARRH